MSDAWSGERGCGAAGRALPRCRGPTVTPAPSRPDDAEAGRRAALVGELRRLGVAGPVLLCRCEAPEALLLIVVDLVREVQGASG